MCSPNIFPAIQNLNINSKDDTENLIVTQILYDKNLTFKQDLDYQLGFKIPVFEGEDLLVEKDFLICYINLPVLTELNVETTFVSVVKKDDFVLI